jgi:predicted metalloprotease with PDZ domain
MAQFPPDAMHVIYTKEGKNRELIDERFSFFDGLFVGQPNGKVSVIAVEKNSKAEQGGVKAGDEIVSVGGIAVNNDLPTFAAAYASAKKLARDNEADNYPMTLRNKEGERTAAIPLPPKFKNALMNDFFNERPKPDKPDTSPPSALKAP